MVIERAIRETQSAISHDVHIADGARKGKHADLLDTYCAVWWTYLMTIADIELLLRRDAEKGTKRPIELNLTAAIGESSAVEFAAKFSE